MADVTLDGELLRYLAMGTTPGQADAAARVVKAASWLRLDARGGLWATHDQLGWQRRIPPLGERMPLL